MSNQAAMLTLCGIVCLTSPVTIPAVADDKDPTAVVANPATLQELPHVVIIAAAPLPGLGLPLGQVPANVQTATSQDMQRQQSLDLTEFMNNNFSGVNITGSQDNPFQPDVNYHGFTASALLGTPEGLSVYVDGVRVNEAFGDTVNWDLIPESAISTVALMSGSNPVFGLNTLGGALAVQTKSGHDFPGTQMEGYGGSFGRRAFEAETGGASGGFDYFLNGNYFDERGWRDLSPSKVRQMFGKAGWQDERTDIDVSYAWADTQLTGNGATPETMLAVRRQAIVSAPDFTHNRLNFINATGSRFLLDDLLLSGNAYYRHLRTLTNNGNINDGNYLSNDYDGPDISCKAPPATRAEVAYCANGANRASTLTQRTVGAGLQLTETQDVRGSNNQAVLGASFDRSRVDYVQRSQYAILTAARTAVSIIDPSNDAQTVNSVGGISKIISVYVSDTLSPNSLLHITAAARYNRIQETLDGFSVNTDVADFDDGFDEPTALSGNHTYDRVNPALGVTITPSKALTLYANYNEGSRAPTVIELGCSNPEQPCGLPDEFASDPDLRQVIARTAEAGARGSLGDAVLDWSLDVFLTNNSHDIQFVATTTTEGYFANVGSTRRQGLDFALGGKLKAFTWRMTYSFVDATYRSNFEVTAQSNSTADEHGNIQVDPGDRIPLIPRHTGRLRLDYALTPRWDVGGSLILSSGSFLHGDENNANQPDGGTILGSGRIGGYSVVNLESTWHVAKAADLFVKVANVFDRRYATAGFLTGNPFNPDGAFRPDPADWTNENAVSPAQPLSLWAGVRVQWE
ncbi:MAG: TonB-dependent receptor [Steroidobacteraceae bacterium]